MSEKNDIDYAIEHLCNIVLELQEDGDRFKKSIFSLQQTIGDLQCCSLIIRKHKKQTHQQEETE